MRMAYQTNNKEATVVVKLNEGKKVSNEVTEMGSHRDLQAMVVLWLSSKAKGSHGEQGRDMGR